MKKFEIKIIEEEGYGITKVFFTDEPMCAVKGIAFNEHKTSEQLDELIKMYDAIPKMKNRNKR